MKYSIVFIGLILSLAAYADQVFTNYEDYYRQLRGVVFSKKTLPQPNDAYSFKGEHGLCGEEDSCQDYHGKIGSRKITITISLASGGFKINDRQFNYSSAGKPLGSEKVDKDAPLYVAAIYIAPKIKNRPDMICIEGNYAGTSSKYKITEVFLVVNPLGTRTNTQITRLPGLLASCLAIRQEPDGSVSYPSNSYISPNKDDTQSTGLLMKNFTVKNGVSKPSNRETKLRFIEQGFIEIGNPLESLSE